MKKRLAMFGAATAISIAGCGSGKERINNENASRQNAPAKIVHTHSNTPQIDVYHGKSAPPKSILALMKIDPLFNSLNRYRQRIYEKREAIAMIGVCATWPNLSGGFTVTVNPGVAEYTTKKGSKMSYLLFSSYDTKTPSGITELNGPDIKQTLGGFILSDDSQLRLDFYNKGYVKDEKITLSEQPVIDQAGREYFKDSKTGQPIMLTGLEPSASFNEANANAACQALLHHTSLPGGELIPE